MGLILLSFGVGLPMMRGPKSAPADFVCLPRYAAQFMNMQESPASPKNVMTGAMIKSLRQK
tara:strand:- start:2130 stop:2312 length:183 start_codon:yes stop_codon:yes gene_type:complete